MQRNGRQGSASLEIERHLLHVFPVQLAVLFQVEAFLSQRGDVHQDVHHDVRHNDDPRRGGDAYTQPRDERRYVTGIM